MANIEYGILVAIILDAVLFFIVTSLNSRKQHSIISYIIGAALLLPLSFQMSCLIGACSVSKTTTTIWNTIGIVSPALKHYVSSATGNFIGWYIFRRVLWSVLFMALAAFGITVTMENSTRRGRMSMRKDTIRRRCSDEYRPSRRR